MIRLFGIVFGGAAVRRRALHADPVGRRIIENNRKMSDLEGAESLKLSRSYSHSSIL